MQTCFNFFRLLFFKWACFKFYLLATLICCLHFTIYQSACIWSTVMSIFPSLVCQCWPWTQQEIRPGLFQKHSAFCNGMLWVFSSFKEPCIIIFFNFLSHCFNMYTNYYFITYIGNPTRLLGQSFLQKQVVTRSPWLLQKSLSYMFDRVLNTPLHLCMM